MLGAVTWLRLLVLLFAFAHATGLSDAVEVAFGDDCEEEAAAGEGADGCDDGCPPICASCSCARCPVASASVAVVVIDPVLPAPARATFVEAGQMPSSRDVDEILRVPISLG
jgi:hypothetical protein